MAAKKKKTTTSPSDEALRAGLKALAQGDVSAQRLKARLTQRGHSALDVDTALHRLASLKLLDDGRAARTEAKKAVAQGLAKALAVARVEAKGVPFPLASSAVEAHYTELGLTDEAVARAVLAKKKVHGAKAARLLAQRGFDEALIFRLTGLDAGA